MPRYLARVELHHATGADRTRLRGFMKDVAFETSITGDNGRRYALPSDEYFVDIETDLQAVRSLVEHAAGQSGGHYAFIVVEIASAAWSLYEQ